MVLTPPVILPSEEIKEKISNYIKDIAQIEKTIFDIKSTEIDLPMTSDEDEINPTLKLIETGLQNLTSLMDHPDSEEPTDILQGQEFVLIWNDPYSGVTK